MILLDANTLIYYIKGLDAVVRRFQLTSPRELRIPSVVAYEVEYGALKAGSARRRAVMAGLLAGIVQAPFDASAAGDADRIRVDLERRGFVIGPMDLIIAGTAVSRGALLVTSNTREFARIKGLRLEDWTR